VFPSYFIFILFILRPSQPLGQDRSFAEMEREEKNKLSHRFKAFRQFKAFLKQSTGL